MRGGLCGLRAAAGRPYKRAQTQNQDDYNRRYDEALSRFAQPVLSYSPSGGIPVCVEISMRRMLPDILSVGAVCVISAVLAMIIIFTSPLQLTTMGDDELTVGLNAEYIDEGAVAKQIIFDYSDDIRTDGAVNTSVPGVYEITYTLNRHGKTKTAVRTVMQQWQSAFGVHFSIVVETAEDAELERRVRIGEYQMVFTTLTFTNTSVLDTLSRFCKGGAGNVAQLQSDKYDTLIQNISDAVYPKDAADALQSAERYLVQQAVILPVGWAQSYLGFAKGVSGIGTNPTGDVLYFKHAIKL